MSTATAPAATAPVKAIKKKTASSKPKNVAAHPKYAEMIRDALTNLKERGGSSRLAILKYIVKKYQLGQDKKLVNAHLKLALRSGIKNGSLKQSKGTGVTGSFRIGAEKQTKAGKKPKAAGAKKPKVTKKPKATGSAAKTQKPKKTAVAGGEGKVKKPKVAKKPKSPAKTAKPAAAKKLKAMKTAKPKVSKAQKPKAVKSKKVAAK